MRLKLIISFALAFSFHIGLAQNICFINTRGIARAKGIDIDFPYLCNSLPSKNTSEDCAISYHIGNTLISEWLVVQIAEPMKDFANPNNKDAVKKSFTSENDKVISVRKTLLGRISSWEIILDKYNNAPSSYDRCVDYIFMKDNYYMSVIFTCTGTVITKKIVIQSFNANYKLFKLLASKVKIN